MILGNVLFPPQRVEGEGLFSRRGPARRENVTGDGLKRNCDTVVCSYDPSAGRKKTEERRVSVGRLSVTAKPKESARERITTIAINVVLAETLDSGRPPGAVPL
jgi:hypothetical protein